MDDRRLSDPGLGVDVKFTPMDPPREFDVGGDEPIRMSDCARIELDPNEQVTFATDSGVEYDVARKSWGYYATPSLNGRLPKFGLRAALVAGPGSRYYVFLIERGKEQDCERYMDAEGHRIVRWLDNTPDLESLSSTPGKL